jgi:hypothetical protein
MIPKETQRGIDTLVGGFLRTVPVRGMDESAIIAVETHPIHQTANL